MKETTLKRTKLIALIALFAALAAVGAFVKIPIGTVPVTLQFAFCNLAMLLLGWKWGTVSIAVYLVLGLVGVPIFTLGGGLGYVLQPTFGYLLGFCLGCLFGGLVCSRGVNGFARRLCGSLVNLVIVYTVGVLYLGLIMKFHLGQDVDVAHIVVAYGLVFLPTDALWAALGALAAPRILPYVWGRDSAEVKRLDPVDGYLRRIASGGMLTERELRKLRHVRLPRLCDAARRLQCVAQAKRCQTEQSDVSLNMPLTHTGTEKSLAQSKGDDGLTPVVIAPNVKFKDCVRDLAAAARSGATHVVIDVAQEDGKGVSPHDLRRLIATARFALPLAHIAVRGTCDRALLRCGADDADRGGASVKI